MNKYRMAYNFIGGYVLFYSIALDDNERFKELSTALGILNELVTQTEDKEENCDEE